MRARPPRLGHTRPHDHMKTTLACLMQWTFSRTCFCCFNLVFLPVRIARVLWRTVAVCKARKGKLAESVHQLVWYFSPCPSRNVRSFPINFSPMGLDELLMTCSHPSLNGIPRDCSQLRLEQTTQILGVDQRVSKSFPVLMCPPIPHMYCKHCCCYSCCYGAQSAKSTYTKDGPAWNPCGLTVYELPPLSVALS